VASGVAVVPIGRVFALEEIREAHRVMEENAAGGKIVVVTTAP
jgi:NADPH:quinone reductase-like Zn-dependent oxidoreductase